MNLNNKHDSRPLRSPFPSPREIQGVRLSRTTPKQKLRSFIRRRTGPTRRATLLHVVCNARGQPHASNTSRTTHSYCIPALASLIPRLRLHHAWCALLPRKRPALLLLLLAASVGTGEAPPLTPCRREFGVGNRQVWPCCWLRGSDSIAATCPLPRLVLAPAESSSLAPFSSRETYLNVRCHYIKCGRDCSARTHALRLLPQSVCCCR